MPKRTQTDRPQPSAENRRRVYAACSECRRRRRKCNGSQPCTQCQAYGYTCSLETEPSQEASSQSQPQTPQLETVQRRRSGGATACTTTTSPPRDHLVVSRERGRLVSALSAVALPRLVGQELALPQPPRLHSYAWNLGIRPERRGAVAGSLSHYLSLPECQALSAVYFAAVHPLFAFLDKEAYYERLGGGWAALEGQPNFAAVVALVSVLGSFFSPRAATHPREQDIKRHGLSILDLGMSNPMAAVDMDSVAAWVLRTLYMRLTTRPAISCMASHTAMHYAEIMGLHRDVLEGTEETPASTSTFTKEELECRRRYFCAARFLNELLNAEYGLSSVSPAHTNCLAPATTRDTHMDILHALTLILREADAAASAGLDSDAFTHLFQRLHDLPQRHPTATLFTADVCLCLLRRFAASSRKPGATITALSATVLGAGLESVSALLADDRTWWNMLGVPFQSVCVCVSADGEGLLALLPTAMGLLRGMADRFGTHMAREALGTARQVVEASRGRTEGKLAIKDAALGHALPQVEEIDWGAVEAGFEVGMEEWPPVLDFFM